MYKTVNTASELPQGDVCAIMSGIHSPLAAMRYDKDHSKVDVYYVKEYGEAVLISKFESKPLIPERRLMR